jgi:hypothetical protein
VAEHLALNQGVVGSNPTALTRLTTMFCYTISVKRLVSELKSGGYFKFFYGVTTYFLLYFFWFTIFLFFLTIGEDILYETGIGQKIISMDPKKFFGLFLDTFVVLGTLLPVAIVLIRQKNHTKISKLIIILLNFFILNLTYELWRLFVAPVLVKPLVEWAIQQ